MKKIVAFCIVLLVCLQGFSQFLLHTVLPMGVGHIVFGDTLLNTRAVLQQEGIKKITAYQTSSGNHSSFTTTSTVTDGRILSRARCYRPSPDSAVRFCLHNSLLYNKDGALQNLWFGSGETTFSKMAREEKGAGNVTITWITKDSRQLLPDTSIYHHVYNAKGQLVSQHYDPTEKYIVNASLYYNADGLLDSIRHEKREWGSFVFERTQKRKNTVLTLETPMTIYKWVYNQAGQCLASEWSSKFTAKLPNGNKGKMSSEVNYSYNQDGTLSKVVEKSGGEKETTVYTYSR
jgi:hypothetical protein